jgi:multidrug resistance efflux pump
MSEREYSQNTAIAELADDDNEIGSLRYIETDEILNQQPSSFIQNSNLVIFIVILFIAIACCVVKYPVVIISTLKLTAEGAPLVVTAKSNARLLSLLVVDNQSVNKGQPLAYLEESTSFQEVNMLSRQLGDIEKAVQRKEYASLLHYEIKNYSDLGAIQSQYQSFEKTFIDFLSFLPSGYQQNKLKVLRSEYGVILELTNNLKALKQNAAEDYALAVNEFVVQEQLYNQKVIPLLDFNKEKSKLLAKKKALQQIETQVIENLIVQSTKEKELMESQRSIQIQEQLFIQELRTLQAEIAIWDKKYVLRAPSKGYVYFTAFLEAGQNIDVGTDLFYVTTQQKRMYAICNVPQQNFGKITLGQQVIIKFNSYPYNEFGSVIGKVDQISRFPDKSGRFPVKVILPNGLRTNYNKRLKYRLGMTAQAEIVTDNVSLFQQMFLKVKNI